MKEIKAFIKPIRVEVVVESLKKEGFDSVTLSKGEGTGAYKILTLLHLWTLTLQIARL